MTKVAPAELKKAAEEMHVGAATFVQSVPIREEHDGATVWDGVVHVFDLKDSPTGASRVYAWSYQKNVGERRFFAVLHLPPIQSPLDAVRAAIVQEHKMDRFGPQPTTRR